MASGRGMPKERAALWIVSTLTGTLQKLREDVWGAAPAPDGSRIAFSNGARNEIWLMGAGGEDARKLRGPERGTRFQGLAWSPDGKRIAYLKVRASGEDVIEALELTSGEPVTIVSGRGLRSFCWAPDGRILYALAQAPPGERSTDVWELRTDPRTARPSGRARRILDGAGFSFPALSLSTDGRRLLLLRLHAQTDVLIGELEAGGVRMSEPQRLTLDDRVDWPSGWMRDSRQVLFYSDRNGTADIFKQAVNDRTPELLSHGPEHDRTPQLSPDGAWILYLSAPPTASGAPLPPERLLRVSVSGGPAEVVLEAGGLAGPPPSASDRASLYSVERRRFPVFRCSSRPAGRCVLAEADEKQLVFSAFNPLEGKKRELTRLDMDPSTWMLWDLSPDGSRIAVTERREQHGRIRILDPDSGATREFSTDWSYLESIAWSHDGQALYVMSWSSRGSSLLRVGLDGQTRVLYRSTTWFEKACPSPDGRYMAFGQIRYNSNAWVIDNFR